jgi:hypothetical protein
LALVFSLDDFNRITKLRAPRKIDFPKELV